MSFQAVEDWLRNLGLLHYAQNFYNHGYEDLETCKLIECTDLDVIGIKHDRDRADLLEAVGKLRRNLYFELEDEALQKDVITRITLEPVILKSKVKELLQRYHVQLSDPPYTNSVSQFF